MDKDYIHGGDFPARRGVDLRQAKGLDGGMMGHDQMEMVAFLIREQPFSVPKRRGSRMKMPQSQAGPSTSYRRRKAGGGCLQV